MDRSSPARFQQEPSAGGIDNLFPSMLALRIPFTGSLRKFRRAMAHVRLISLETGLKHADIDCTDPASLSETRSVLFSTSVDMFNARENVTGIPYVGHPDQRVVDWRSATIGHQMLTSALQRSNHEDENVARLLYIDALKYLHCGLPQNLSPSEVDSLQRFLPDVAVRNITDSCGTLENQIAKRSASDSSLVRSGTANLVASLTALLIFMLPMMISLLSWTLEYERQNQLFERAANHANRLVRSAAGASLKASDQIVKMGQSPLGTYCIIKLASTLQNIAEGVSDGLERSRVVQGENFSGKRILL